MEAQRHVDRGNWLRPSNALQPNAKMWRRSHRGYPTTATEGTQARTLYRDSWLPW